MFTLLNQNFLRENQTIFSIFRYKQCQSFGQLIEPFYITEVIIYCLVFARIDQPVDLTVHSH